MNANLLTGGLDQYFSRTEGAVSRFFMTDALVSTLALTDSSQAVQTSYTYEPFGKVTQTGAASTNSLKYTGREDDGTGLFYYRARYYNPTMQRFISEDPIGLEGGLNKYSYAADNPLMYSDPGGTNPLLLLGACIIGGGINAINYAINGKDPLTGFGIGFVATGVGILTTTVTGPAGLAILAEGTAISAGAVTTGIATTTANRFNGVYSSPDPAFDYAIGIVGSYGSAKVGIAVAGAKGGQAVPVVAGFIGEAVGNNTVNVGFTGLGILYPELWRNINNPLRGIIPNYPYPGSGTRR